SRDPCSSGDFSSPLPQLVVLVVGVSLVDPMDARYPVGAPWSGVRGRLMAGRSRRERVVHGSRRFMGRGGGGLGPTRGAGGSGGLGALELAGRSMSPGSGRRWATGLLGRGGGASASRSLAGGTGLSVPAHRVGCEGVGGCG